MNLADLDRKHIWHPLAPSPDWPDEPPLVIDRAEGNELVAADGRRYLDGASSLWATTHGHTHPVITQAIADQLARVPHATMLGLANTPSILLANKLISIAPPGLARVFFSDSGPAAIEAALKIAFQFQQLRGHKGRTKFLALTNSHHGGAITPIGAGGSDTFRQIFHPLLLQTIPVEPTHSAVERAIRSNADSLAAFIVEPLVQSSAGMCLSPPGLLAHAARLCREHGILLIADEIASGFGRTGTLFACEQEAVTPDLLTLAKGLAGGYLPVAATLTTAEIFDEFLEQPEQSTPLFHANRFGGNPLGCAAALASLQLFEHDRTIAGLPPKIDQFARALSHHIAPLEHVYEIRHKGLMVGIELRRDCVEPYPEDAAIGARVCRTARQHGVILHPIGPVIALMPPLSITPQQIDHLVGATAAAIADATEGGHSTARLPRSPSLAQQAPRPTSAPHSGPRGIFITGTDTGVGKTAVGLALLAAARRRGIRVAPLKPVETDARPHPADAMRLRAAAGLDAIPIADLCPYTFPDPVAPAAAAHAAGTAIEPERILAAAHRLSALADLLIVESAGGLLSPYAPTLTAADLAATLGLPILLIARNALGTINHAALAINEIRRRALPLAGLVLVDTAPTRSPDQAANATLIHSLTGLRPLGTLPFVATPTPDALADALEAALPVDGILEAARLLARP